MPCVPYRGPDASGSCDAKTFAGWTSPPNYGASIRDGVTHGLCGYEADTTEEKCSTYYAEGLQDEGTFYQCRWLSATGKSGKQVNLCVTWSAENKRWTHAAPTKRKLWRCWKLVKTAMPSFGAMREVANGKAPHNLATSWVPGHRGRRIPWTTTRGVGVCHRTAYTAMAMPCGRTAWATGRRITGSISTSRLVDAWARINVEMSWAH